MKHGGKNGDDVVIFSVTCAMAVLIQKILGRDGVNRILLPVVNFFSLLKIKRFMTGLQRLRSTIGKPGVIAV